MSSLICLFLTIVRLCDSQPFSLSANKHVSYVHSMLCPRTNTCLQLSSQAQLLGQYSWPQYKWTGNFTVSFWYYAQPNSNSNNGQNTVLHNIISNCHSNGLSSNITSFLFGTQIDSQSPKTSHLNVYFNNSQQCNSVDNTHCTTHSVQSNNVWQFITVKYNEKTGFYVYSNTTLLSNITWNGTKHNRNPIQSNNVLCIGDGNVENDGFLQLLTDIRFYNKSIASKTMKHLFDLNYNLTRNDNDGIFAYYDFVNNETTNNVDHLCLHSFYIKNISPKALSINGGDALQINGNFGNDITANTSNIKIVLYDKYDSKWTLNIPTIWIVSVTSTKIRFDIKESLKGICSDTIYINITSNTNDQCIISNTNVSIAVYSPTIKVLPNQLPAINSFNITVESECLPMNDNTLHCGLSLNNIKRDVSAKIIVSNTQPTILCQFPDLSSLLPSTNYNMVVYSKKYNYTTANKYKVTVYNAPSIKELSVYSFSDNEQGTLLLIYGSNFVYSQPFDCNFIDPRHPNALIYNTKAEINPNNAYVSCLVSTNLITPYNDYKFYLSSKDYFNSSKIPINIQNSAPYLPNTIFAWNNHKNEKEIYPSSSLQYFQTQIVDESYNNFTSIPAEYEFKLQSQNCPSLQFVSNPLHSGLINWSYTAPPAFNTYNFSCLINFTASDFNQHKSVVSFMLFELQFQTMRPIIKSVNNTLFLRNNITDFRFELQNLYLDNYDYYYYKYNVLWNNNMSLKCVFINAKDKNSKFEAEAILLSANKQTNIQTMQCPSVIISEIGQYTFQFEMIEFTKAYTTDPFNKPNSIIYAFDLPHFDRVNLNKSFKHIFIYGSNFFIGANALAINEWNVNCSFGERLYSVGHVINDSCIFCVMPDIDHSDKDNVRPIVVTYYSYTDSYQNMYKTFNELLFLTNLSLSFTTQCPGYNCNGNGYCDVYSVCHCDIGYSGDACDLPLYYMILSAFIILFLVIVGILLFCCRKYQRKYHKLKLKSRQYQYEQKHKNNSKIYGYGPIDDEDNWLCCFNLTPGFYGYYLCCQFCCFGDENTNQTELPKDETSYTSTFQQQKLTANAARQFRAQFRAQNDNDDDLINNADSDSDSNQDYN